MRRLNGNQARQVVTVTPTTGGGAWGSTPGDSVDVRCILLSKRALVRDRNGTEVVSEVTVLAAPEHNPNVPDLEALFEPGLTVSVRGTDREVIGANPATNRGRLIYLSVSLT